MEKVASVETAASVEVESVDVDDVDVDAGAAFATTVWVLDPPDVPACHAASHLKRKKKREVLFQYKECLDSNAS